jgi:hypothetical protein
MDWPTMGGHGLITGLIIWLIQALKRHGVKFDFRIWRNGKPKSEDK